VDIQGVFVGIVSAVLERGGSAAGILTTIVPAQQVEVTVKSAITQFEARTPGPSPEAPASSIPDIVCETSAVRVGCGDIPLGARSRGFMLTPVHGL
jgi:hypothetical protein